LKNRRNLADEKRARHFIKKAARQVQKFNETKQQKPSNSNFWCENRVFSVFQRKITFFDHFQQENLRLGQLTFRID